MRQAERRDGLLRLVVDSGLVREGLELGGSVSVNGCCQTVVAIDGTGFAVEAMPQTLALTTLGELAVGDEVNLEGALRAGEPLGGHWVLGHVDAVGEVTEVRVEGADRRVTLRAPGDLLPFVAARGSVAVDGVSLTVAAVGQEGFEVALIPTTWRGTVAGRYRAGSRVNLEVDVVARYVERLLSAAGEPRSRGRA